MRVLGSGSRRASRPFGAAATAEARRALGVAAWSLDAVVQLQRLASSADPIELPRLGNKGAPVCSDPGQQYGACPGTKAGIGVENVGIKGAAERRTEGDHWKNECIEMS